jgi:hypothetical protein
MRGTCPSEVRIRVIGLVEARASRCEAAEQLEISTSFCGEMAAALARGWHSSRSCSSHENRELVFGQS